MITNTSMSVFNKNTDEKKNVFFKKHVIEHVFWDDSKGVNLNHGYENADDVNVFIPKDVNNLTEYVEAKQYNGTGWTLQNGDFIVRGNVEEDIVEGIKDLQKKYNTFAITLVDDKDFGSTHMHHFEIRGNKGGSSY